MSTFFENSKVKDVEIIEKVQIFIHDNSEGFFIITNKQVIKLEVFQNPREYEDGILNWTYNFNKNKSKFIGTQLKDIKIIEQDVKLIKTYDFCEPFEGKMLVIEFKNNKSGFKFFVANEYSREYPHKVKIQSNQLTCELSV